MFGRKPQLLRARGNFWRAVEVHDIIPAGLQSGNRLGFSHRAWHSQRQQSGAWLAATTRRRVCRGRKFRPLRKLSRPTAKQQGTRNRRASGVLLPKTTSLTSRMAILGMAAGRRPSASHYERSGSALPARRFLLAWYSLGVGTFGYAFLFARTFYQARYQLQCRSGNAQPEYPIIAYATSADIRRFVDYSFMVSLSAVASLFS
jgi:hypothetical protein